MRFFLSYLRERRAQIAAFFVLSGTYAVFLALYHMPLAVSVYPAALCAVMGMGALLYGACRETQRHRRLTAAAALGAELVEQALPVPRTQQERDYQAMIRSLCREQREAMGQIHQRYADALGYFTVWAHQIKTPIAAMRLRMQGEDSALARRLSTQITRVTQYVDMAMTYLRLESQSTDYVIRECALDDVVRAGVKTFAAEFIERKLALHYEPVHVRVVTDEKWLGFVIEQLLSNALKYTQHGGITIRMEDEDTLCIEDTGIGIAAEDMPRLFEQGFTGLNGRDHRRASGLGLFLCRRILTNLHHSIRMESELHRGTRVYIGLGRPPLGVE